MNCLAIRDFFDLRVSIFVVILIVHSIYVYYWFKLACNNWRQVKIDLGESYLQGFDNISYF